MKAALLCVDAWTLVYTAWKHAPNTCDVTEKQQAANKKRRCIVIMHGFAPPLDRRSTFDYSTTKTVPTSPQLSTRSYHFRQRTDDLLAVEPIELFKIGPGEGYELTHDYGMYAWYIQAAFNTESKGQEQRLSLTAAVFDRLPEISVRLERPPDTLQPPVHEPLQAVLSRRVQVSVVPHPVLDADHPPEGTLPFSACYLQDARGSLVWACMCWLRPGGAQTGSFKQHTR